MGRTLEAPAELAAEQARQAGARARVALRLLEHHEDFRQASDIFQSVWGTGPANSQMPAELIRALTHSGNYAAGAFDDAEMVGAVVGFFGRDPGRAGSDDVYLHSHILGVAPAVQARSIGYALKQHQRAWALEQGLRKVTWTFDPLVSRNAYFNVHKLGAEATAYYDSFYGKMLDGINAGDESDRVLIVWKLDERRVAEALSSRRTELKPNQLIASGARVALSADEDGNPRTAVASGRTVLCAIPEDIITLRRTDPKLALQWRRALRETLGSALNDGYTVSGFTRSGWYVLERDAAT